jgi:hypothetical protein
MNDHHRYAMVCLVSRLLLITLFSAFALAIPSTAAADPPTLLAVSQQSRHPAASYSMPGADLATIYFATRPGRATDGSFLQENIAESDLLTTAEMQSGFWTDGNQIDPGTYYGMVYASDFDCAGQPGCLDGYSNVLTLTVPKPRPTYQGTVEVLHYVHVAYLALRVKPLGESLPYKVCWRLKNGRRRCVRGKVHGYSWNNSATDDVTVGLRGMKNRTTFAWYVRGHKVAAKTANTTRR